MELEEEQLYVVTAAVLPEVILRTALAKELLVRGEAATIREAVQKAGLSRSAFYKYKDGIFPLHSATQGKVITITMNVDHRPGVLSKVLNAIAQVQGNILTINQGIPLQGVANVTASLETSGMQVGLNQLLSMLGEIAGVKFVDVVAKTD